MPPTLVRACGGGERPLEDSARALGRLIGTVASCTLTDQLVVAGEGSGIVDGFQAQVHAGIDEIRQSGSTAVQLHIEPPIPEPWARGAATSAIESYVLGGA